MIDRRLGWMLFCIALWLAVYDWMAAYGVPGWQRLGIGMLASLASLAALQAGRK